MHKKIRSLLVETLIQPLYSCLLFLIQLLIAAFIWGAWAVFFLVIFMPLILFFPDVIIFPLLFGIAQIIGAPLCAVHTWHALEAKGLFKEHPLPKWLRGDG